MGEGDIKKLVLVGLGLGHPDDITIKGLKAVKASTRVFLEAYTSTMTGFSLDDLNTAFERTDIVEADREAVEQGTLLKGDPEDIVSLMVVGDPLSATTHSDLMVRCKEAGIEWECIHNTSVMTAVAGAGLQLYRYGEAISLCFWGPHWRPTSWYQKIAGNRSRELHTLCLLDIKMKEMADEDIAKMGRRGRSLFEAEEPEPEYRPARFMTVGDAVHQLLVVEDELVAKEAKRKEGGEDEEEEGDHTPPGAYNRDTLAIGVSRLGSPQEVIIAATLGEFEESLNTCDDQAQYLYKNYEPKPDPPLDFGQPLHSLLLCGTMDDAEREAVKRFMTPRALEAERRREEAEVAKRQAGGR